MAYTPPQNPTVPADNYNMLKWFDEQAQANATGPNAADWQTQWNAANFGSPAGGQGNGPGLMLGQGMQPPTDAKGQWVMSGQGPGAQDGGQGGSSVGYNRWTFIPNQPAAAPAQRQAQEEAPQQAAPADGKTIYNDWDTYQNKARADVEGINRMPFMYSDYAGVSLDPQKAMQQFYPAAWQAEGVQKTIGPNGQNIAPYLNRDFNDPQFLDTTKQDMPSLVAMMLNRGSIDERQSQALLELMKPKKLDTSFANTMMAQK